MGVKCFILAISLLAITNASLALNSTTTARNITRPSLNASIIPLNITRPSLNTSISLITTTHPSPNATTTFPNPTSPPLKLTIGHTRDRFGYNTYYAWPSSHSPCKSAFLFPELTGETCDQPFSIMNRSFGYSRNCSRYDGSAVVEHLGGGGGEEEGFVV